MYGRPRPARNRISGASRIYFTGLILGPGDIDQAHQPDEYLRLDRIDPTLDLLERMIGEFCVTRAAP